MRLYSIQFICLQLSFFLFSSLSLAMVSTQASDIDYYTHSNPSFSLIFSENLLEKNKKPYLYVHEKITYYDDIYREIFSKKLKEVPIYIFSSSRNQISNAVTSSIPFLRVLFFSTGVEHITRLATTSWEDTVIAHEMAHIFQLGQSSDILKYLKIIFRNSEIIFLPIPIFLNTNLVMSLFLLEGHAVLSESLFAPGGRLYSGWTRALILSQLKHRYQTTDQFIRNYLLNFTDDTFSVEQQYAHGGYFFKTLLKKYDIHTINNFFTQHAEHFIAPLSFISVKSSFEHTFKTSFSSLANYYIQEHLPLATQQVKSPEKTLFKSHICPAFNKKESEIFFLKTNLRSTPYLIKLNAVNGEWTHSRFTSSVGKIFKLNNKYYVTASHEISPTERVYGLFSEGMHLVKKYKSQQLQDFYKNKVLSLDTSNNIGSYNLILNKQFYDQVSSPALFGPDGSVYYFKQNQNQRVMYKNKKPLFQFKGFYGKPTEITADGTIYFIASSIYGSSLFAWTEHEGFLRISPSDVIVDALQMEDGRFIVCEIEPEYYSYKIIEPRTTQEAPAFYNYPSFKKASNSLTTLSAFTKMKSAKTSSLLVEDSSIEDKKYIENLKELDKIDTIHSPSKLEKKQPAENPQVYRAYSPIRHIRFNGIELSFFNDPITGYNGLVNVSLKDPLGKNSFQFAYQTSTENWTLQNIYNNQVYRLSWNLQYIYKQGLENFAGSRTYSYIHEISQGFLYPLFKKGYWGSTFFIKNAWSQVEMKDISNPFYYFSTEPSLRFSYRRAYSKNFDFHRNFLLEGSLQYHYDISNQDSNLRAKVKSYYTLGWGAEFYTSPFITYQTALKEKSIPLRFFKPLNVFKNTEFTFLARERIFEETNEYLTFGMNFQKFIETPIYFTRFPFSLRGIAPVFKAQYIQFLDNNESKKIKNMDKRVNFVEYTFGFKFALLIHHKVKAKINIYSGYSMPTKWNIRTKLISEKNNLIKDYHFGLKFSSKF